MRSLGKRSNSPDWISRKACVPTSTPVSPRRAANHRTGHDRIHRARRFARMDVKRGVERLERFEQRQVLRRVEVFTGSVAVDDGALHARKLERALELADGALDVLRRQGRERHQACRITGTGIGRVVVRFGGEAACRGGLEHLDARRGEQQELHVDSVRIHSGNARLAEIHEWPGEECRRPTRSIQRQFGRTRPGVRGEDSGGEEAFLARDAAIRLSVHCDPPVIPA